MIRAMNRSIVCGSVTVAIKAKKALTNHGVKAHVERLSRASEIYGCGYCITVPSADLLRALEILNKQFIRYKGVLEEDN